MASALCVRRLTKEINALKKEPIKEPRIQVAPNEKNILELHYVIEGNKDTPYEGGIYHGKLVFPKEYPLKPPSVIMLTPSGRFQTNRRLCLSMSDFHPETWNPMWSVSTILTGLYSFMTDTKPTFGSMETTYQAKRQFAASSLEYNVKRDPDFSSLFPEYVERYEREMQESLKHLEHRQSEEKLLTSDTQRAGTFGLDQIDLPRAFFAVLAGVVALLSIFFAGIRFL